MSNYISLGRWIDLGFDAGFNASAWDHVSPSPVPIRASGSSVRTSSSKHSGRSYERTFSTEASRSYEVN